MLDKTQLKLMLDSIDEVHEISKMIKRTDNEIKNDTAWIVASNIYSTMRL